MRKVIIVVAAMYFTTFAKAQTGKLDSMSWHTIVDTFRNLSATNTGYLTYTSYIRRPDTVSPYNVVGVYGDGSLRMFEAKYLTSDNGYDWSVIGAYEGNLKNLIGLYSYEDYSGVHTLSMAVCHKKKKDEKVINWKPHGVKCCN